MKAKIIGLAVLTLVAGAQAQPWAAPGNYPPGRASYDPAKGPLPLDERYVMTRKGLEASRYEAMNPQTVAQTQPAAQPTPPARTGAPEWFVRLPEDTETEIWAAATATSTDEQMAYDKARMQAERKLVESMGAKIRTLTKSYRNDQGAVLVEKFEQTIQKTADGSLVGVRRMDSQVQFDGRVYKVYVLLRYPLGESNILRREQQAQRQRQEADLRSARAHQELEKKTQQERDQQSQDAEAQKKDLGPVPEPTVENTPQSKVTPVTVPTAQGDLKLLDVNNEEYKRRRDEALEKPGAVIGQSVVR